MNDPILIFLFYCFLYKDDDASARRLGAGASFYGKRKSNFYGEGDKMKKADRDTYDPTGNVEIEALLSNALCLDQSQN